MTNYFEKLPYVDDVVYEVVGLDDLHPKTRESFSFIPPHVSKAIKATVRDEDWRNEEGESPRGFALVRGDDFNALMRAGNDALLAVQLFLRDEGRRRCGSDV